MVKNFDLPLAAGSSGNGGAGANNVPAPLPGVSVVFSEVINKD